MGCGSHFGGKARWEGFCVGVGLVGALCGTELCAGKRAWLSHSSLQSSPPRFPSCLTLQFHPPCFPSCLTRHSLPSVIFAAFPPVFGALRAPSAPALQSILAVCPFSILTLSALLKCPAFCAMRDIYLTGCGSSFYVSLRSSAIDGCVRVLVFLSKLGRVGRRMDGNLVSFMEFWTYF